MTHLHFIPITAFILNVACIGASFALFASGEHDQILPFLHQLRAAWSNQHLPELFSWMMVVSSTMIALIAYLKFRQVICALNSVGDELRVDEEHGIVQIEESQKRVVSWLNLVALLCSFIFSVFVGLATSTPVGDSTIFLVLFAISLVFSLLWQWLLNITELMMNRKSVFRMGTSIIQTLTMIAIAVVYVLHTVPYITQILQLLSDLLLGVFILSFVPEFYKLQLVIEPSSEVSTFYRPLNTITQTNTWRLDGDNQPQHERWSPHRLGERLTDSDSDFNDNDDDDDAKFPEFV